MKFVVLFEDNAGTGDAVRSKHMPDHLSFLKKHSTKIEAAGPLREQDGAGAGGLWIVEAETASKVQELIEDDPFWPTGLRKSVRIVQWIQVFANGQIASQFERDS